MYFAFLIVSISVNTGAQIADEHWIWGFLSTAIQFGIGQLYDTSAKEISAFLVW